MILHLATCDTRGRRAMVGMQETFWKGCFRPVISAQLCQVRRLFEKQRLSGVDSTPPLILPALVGLILLR